MGVSYVVLVLLIIVSIPLIMCIVYAERYADYVKAVDASKVSGAKYLGIGFAMIDILKIDFHKVSYVQQREQAGTLFGKKFADFYLRVLYAQSFTYSMIILYSVVFLSCLTGGTDGVLLAFCGTAAAGAVFVYYLSGYKRQIEKLNVEYMAEFPGAVSTIALLVNGGVFLRDAWKAVAYSSDKPLFMQMRKVIDDMNNGFSESAAITRFADRCSTKEIRKFSSIIVQAVSKGGRDLADTLIKQSDSLLNARRQLALQQGEKASNKLMIPIMLVFAGILIMVMMPIMSSMSF